MTNDTVKGVNHGTERNRCEQSEGNKQTAKANFPSILHGSKSIYMALQHGSRLNRRWIEATPTIISS
jgi:hypothetical protein